MHWILTVPDNFVLTQVIQRSQWLLQPPFGVNHAAEHLTRVERLASGHTIALAISQAPAGLVLETDERLSGKDTEEISHKTWRMLRLGENLRPFLEVANHTPGLEASIRYGVHLLRGTSLFEDIVKSIVFTMKVQARQGAHLAWIVDRFGDPLSSNPTRHAFPTPQQLLRGERLLCEALGDDVGQQLAVVAETFDEEANTIAAMTSESIPVEQLADNLEQLFGLGETTIGLMMLNLGRYEFIPTDGCARQRVSKYLKGRSVAPEDIRAMFEPLHPWGGLAYWLWDWSTALPLQQRSGATLWKT